ncbi:MAG: hypothetical protein WCP77_18975, partial [Roseococcus sp.]
AALAGAEYLLDPASDAPDTGRLTPLSCYLQAVAQGHQLIYLGGDAVLFCEGRKRDRNPIHSIFWEAAPTCAGLFRQHEGLEVRRPDQQMEECP